MTPARPAPRATITVCIAVALALSAFAYRFNTLGGPLAGFENDHFEQLLRAMAVADGEQPIRDFVDAELRALWPAPTYSVSALAQDAFGRSLRSEALLTIGMLSIGAGLIFWIATQFAGSIAPALMTTLLAIALRPELYNYPKIIVYALAFASMLAYARRPTRVRLATLGVVAVIGGLYRHDHGVFIALADTALLLFMHGRQAWRPLALLVLTCLVLLMPGIVLAQVHGGFLTYLRDCINVSRQEASRTTEAGLHFSIDRSQRLLARAPRPQPPPPRVAIRWVPALTSDARLRAESDLQLADPVQRTDESNWSYAITNPSAEHLAAIVRDSRVRDTDGIDRSTFALTAAPPPQPPRWRQELTRWRIAPGVFRYDNAAPWLYLIAWSVVLFSIVCAAWPALARAVSSPAVPVALLRAACVLALLMLIVLLRNPNPSRIADVSVPVAILGAWLMAAIPRGVSAWPRAARWAAASGVTIVLCVTIAAVVALGEAIPQLNAAGVGSVSYARQQWSDVWRTLGALPESLTGIDDTLARASAYLRRCTQPTDRLLVGDNLPEVYYFADRRFAAGQFAYFSNFYTAPEFQREAVARWRAQAVPIALMQGSARFDDEFASDYPLLADYLRARYRKTGMLLVERGVMLDVWVDKAVAMGSDRDTGLPCEVRR